VNNRLNKYIGGIAIILLGIVLLLRNLDFLYFDDEYIVGLVFGALGLLFFFVYFRDVTKWWTAIPAVGGLIVFISIFIDKFRFIPNGFIGAGTVWLVALVFFIVYFKDRSQKWALLLTSVLGAAGMIIFFAVFISETRILPESFIGTAVLWIIAAVFLGVYVRNRENWWAIIPAGVLTSIGFTVLADEVWYFYGETVAFILFLGFALTFLILYVLRNEQNQLEWAKYPAIVLGVFSFFLLFVNPHNRVGDVVFPILVILVGLYMVIRNYQTKENKVTNNNSVVPK